MQEQRIGYGDLGMKRMAMFLGAAGLMAAAGVGEAAAKSCAELRALCWTMRSDKSDCTQPYQRCLATGTFITPLGRVFKATSR